MALTPPDVDDLRLHMQKQDQFSTSGDPSEEDFAEDALRRATNLMQLATELDTEPEDTLEVEILREGILAMAHMILITGGEDREAMYAPYSSERIGSYSYSKAAAAVASATQTGVPEFDIAVSLFSTNVDGVNRFNADGEKVFVEPYAASKRYVDPDVESLERSVILKPDAYNE